MKMKSLRQNKYAKMQLSSQRLIVRPYYLKDYKICVDSQKGRLPKRGRFDEAIPTASAKNYESFKKRIMQQRKNAAKGSHFVFAVFERKSGSYVGQIDLFSINRQLRWGNLGYCIQNQYWNLGYATEACLSGMRIAFKELGYHRVEAAMELVNKASIRVAMKIGMTREGVRRKFFFDNGGVDMLVYSTNSIDWRLQRIG